MRKSVLRGSICAAVFIISMILISIVTNKGNTDMTVKMEPASFPLVYMDYNGQVINCLHGYASDMQTDYMRGTITPIQKDRKVTWHIDKYGSKIQGLTLEVRSVDGTRLIESTQIKDYTETKTEIQGSLILKDLIEEQEEYTLVLLVTTDRDTIRYYTRIRQAEDSHMDEKIAFVYDFHKKTFLKDRSIARYLEANEEGDNTTYQTVNIHSSFQQITWGNLSIKQTSKPVLSVQDLNKETASMRLDYFVTIGEAYYRVSEFYRIRYGTERMYLLDYERKMNQIFRADADSFAKNKIQLGIVDPGIAMKESEDGNVIAFYQENSLYSFNATDRKCICLFSFYNAENDDLRNTYPLHSMKILSVEETGNIRFLVYGYMNRGRHEGHMGIQVYYYNSMLNTIEEDVFIPYSKSYELLHYNMEQLSYVSKNNIFYFILDGTIYSVDLTSKASQIVVKDLREDSFKVSRENNMIVWQTGTDSYHSSELILMNLNSHKQTKIKAPTGYYIAPIGFMRTDLIYGIANKQDIIKDNTGKITFPMNQVFIQNESGDILKQYREDSIYVVGGEVQDNLLTLKRVRGMESSPDTTEETNFPTEETNLPTEVHYTTIEDDQITDNMEEIKRKNKIEVAATQTYEKIVQIALKSDIPVQNIKFSEPKEVLFEGGREIILPRNEEEREVYYVYGQEGIEQIYAEPSEAINLAYRIAGVVINEDGEYVWTKGNLATKNQIMKIKATLATEEISAAAICMDTILKCEDITRNTQYLLNQGATIQSILTENLEQAQVLMLAGCSLESVLYYVNQDIPVMALQMDGTAVLIIGFNELNIVLMDPTTGTIYKKGMKDSTAWFEENGNQFITYIRH
ncbi:MAG: hypothetical protein RRX92_00245 [Lachnospiraceae bacterium]